jgi:hypothetical protein
MASLLLFIVTIPAAASPRAGYTSFLKEGRVWEYVSHHFEFKDEYRLEYDELVSIVRYIQRGDTVIGGREYSKFYRQEDGGEWQYDLAIREEGSTAYCVMKGNSQEMVHIELDPDRFEGTSLWFSLRMDPEERVDSISVGGRLFVRHRYKHRGDDDSITYYLAVEGVGYSINALILGMRFIHPTRTHDYMTFQALYEDGNRIFTKEDFSAPAFDGTPGETRILNAEMQQGVHSLPYCDLQGRRLSGKPTNRGLYINDGKKVLITK